MGTESQLQAKAPQITSVTPVGPRLLQRACACGQHTASSGGECEECKKKHEGTLQRAATNFAQVNEVPPIVHDVLRSPGQPLDGTTLSFMEPRFDHDFSSVRVHTDAKAAESVRAVDALAYTVGRDVVFGAGEYMPEKASGRRLLAHELAHVVQQNFSSSQEEIQIDPSTSAEQEARDFASRIDGPIIFEHFRKPLGAISRSLARSLQRGSDRCSGAGASCASTDQCSRPDPGKEGRNESSTTWELEVNIDTERSSWESALRNQEFGHTYIRFWESTGREYTYGFYPASELPNENRRTVPGCVHHPDTTHNACIDDVVSYSLTQEQYSAALTLAQRLCREGHTYGTTYTCTTYAEDVVRAGSKTLPSSRSQPTTVFYQQVPSIDNPNTLFENVQVSRGALNTDTGIRAWVSSHDSAAIAQLPTQEMIRMINRLLDGWISDDDVVTIERICQSVSTLSQMVRIRNAITPRIIDMTDIGQRTRVRTALGRNP